MSAGGPHLRDGYDGYLPLGSGLLTELLDDQINGIDFLQLICALLIIGPPRCSP